MIKSRLSDSLCVISITVLCEELWQIACILWPIWEAMPSAYLQHILLYVYMCVSLSKYFFVCLFLENLTAVYSTS